MTDTALNLLVNELRQPAERRLWIVDENIPPQLLAPQTGTQVVGNRFDLIRAMREQGWNAELSDFDLGKLPDASIEQIIYRVSKEKAVVHHLINEAARLLGPNGKLILIGDKGEGIKTYARKAQQRLGGAKAEQKQGSVWRCELSVAQPADAPLDDQNYAQMRELDLKDAGQYLSKPGLFGWNKIDRGSAFLVENLAEMLDRPLPVEGSILDLGCGFGYLALNACAISAELTCTDNNAAALIACRANLEARGYTHAQVVASDAGDTLQQRFDTILCNPPFHAGFGVEGDLTDRFLQQTQRLLTPNGTACFVVNLHIPLERKAQGLFAQIHCHADNGHFKLIQLSKPKG
ncbi:class I SAM-dependent methyltransferase [Marinobacterium lutimaris]|uniref:16S rRNA m(2)G 1207 methyltransferase n=1 Tax=Marinobacterium lutimaris TaxID=568106 RepID=A0A1H6D7I5_9GAMM|nr:methyltransferase [Marinobacterium lutimaris]SEG80476.1 16S rRNA m(2)G 1207 methyltransferase [Marinobacterium lutimaris]